MDVTTGLRLGACGGILAMLISAPVLADKVTIESGSYTLNGDIVPVGVGRVVLIVHGTLGHKDMELIEALQSVFMESGQASLAINLSLNIGTRRQANRPVGALKRCQPGREARSARRA